MFHVNLGDTEPETRPALKYTKDIVQKLNYTTADRFKSKIGKNSFFATPCRRPSTAHHAHKIHKTTNDQQMNTNGSEISLSEREEEDQNSLKLRKKSSNIKRF